MVSFLGPGNHPAETSDELIVVFTQRAQEAPVEQVAVYPVVRDSGVDLSRVDSGHPLPLTSLLVRFFLLWERRAKELIRSDGFVASACPVDHHGLGKALLPGNGQRRIAFPVGECEEAVLEVDCAGLIFDSEVPLAPSRRMRFGSLTRRSRQLESAEKNACTQASAVWACRCDPSSLGNRRIRCLGRSQVPVWRTVRQKKTSVRL